MGKKRDPQAAAAMAQALLDSWDKAGGDAAGGQDLTNDIQDRIRGEQEQQGGQ